MAKQTFKGRAILPGNLEGEALVSKLPFNLTGSYFENMFAGNTETAPCTDANNEALFRKDMKGAIMCTSQCVGSTMGAGALMGVSEMGVGLKAFLFSHHIDSIAAGGLIIDDIWYGRRVITVDLLGEEFLDTVKTGDSISIKEDGTVTVG
jgi:predicted aconitase with swiveling domain